MKYSCKTCNYETDDKSNFNKHLKSTSHNKLIKLVSEDANDKVPRSYDCKCGKKFSHPSSLSRHKKTCNGVDLISTISQLNSKLDQITKTNENMSKQIAKLSTE